MTFVNNKYIANKYNVLILLWVWEHESIIGQYCLAYFYMQYVMLIQLILIRFNK